MLTKPLVRHAIPALDTPRDLSSINRLLAAASVSPRFCAGLLANPEYALQSGFGGEYFPLSQPTKELMVSIRASTLSEFVSKLDEKLSYKLLIS